MVYTENFQTKTLSVQNSLSMLIYEFVYPYVGYLLQITYTRNTILILQENTVSLMSVTINIDVGIYRGCCTRGSCQVRRLIMTIQTGWPLRLTFSTWLWT